MSNVKNVKCLFIVVMHLATPSQFTDMPLKLKETNISNEHSRLKNPNWRRTDQLAVYKHDREVKLGSTEEQLQLTNQTDLRIPRLGFLPLGHIPPPPSLCRKNMNLLVMTSSWRFFLNFRFYKKSNRTAQSPSLNARYGMIVGLHVPSTLRGTNWKT